MKERICVNETLVMKKNTKSCFILYCFYEPYHPAAVPISTLTIVVPDSPRG